MLFVGGMVLAAALPTLALEYPGGTEWIRAGGSLMGSAYLLYRLLMLWLTLVAMNPIAIWTKESCDENMPLLCRANSG